MIYLDYAANTPVDPHVLETYMDSVKQCFGNANSHHSMGYQAKQIMDHTTEKIATLLSVKENEIIYTSGATESNNTAIKGIVQSSRHIGRHIITSFLEHSSVSGALTSLQEQGYEIDSLRIMEDGTIDLEDLRELLRKDTVLVTLCAVESELGIKQPIKEVHEILKAYPNAKLHVDATQAIGKIPFDFSYADTISFAPHKFYGINGSGILIKKEHVILPPLLHGGASTTIYRSGTPVPSLAQATEVALEIALLHMKERFSYVEELQLYLIGELKKRAYIRINNTEYSIPYFVNFSTAQIMAKDMQNRLDEKGVFLSVKSACSVENTPSRPVFAITKDKKNALRSLRISLSHLTTKEEINKFLEILDLCYKEEKLK